jgi:thymidylate synthase (FAD)
MSSINEMSARYTKIDDTFYTPNQFRKQCPKNKQSSLPGFTPQENDELQQIFHNLHHHNYQTYLKLLDMGVAKELARTILPQSIYTQLYLKMDLRNALHFCNLRNAPDAQWETQQIAAAIEDIIKDCCPISYATFRNPKNNQ